MGRLLLLVLLSIKSKKSSAQRKTSRSAPAFPLTSRYLTYFMLICADGPAPFCVDTKLLDTTFFFFFFKMKRPTSLLCSKLTGAHLSVAGTRFHGSMVVTVTSVSEVRLTGFHSSAQLSQIQAHLLPRMWESWQHPSLFTSTATTGRCLASPDVLFSS